MLVHQQVLNLVVNIQITQIFTVHLVLIALVDILQYHQILYNILTHIHIYILNVILIYFVFEQIII